MLMQMSVAHFSVLIVDDSADLRRRLRELLRERGITDVREAASAAAGIEAIRASLPDVLLLDGPRPCDRLRHRSGRGRRHYRAEFAGRRHAVPSPFSVGRREHPLLTSSARILREIARTVPASAMLGPDRW